MSEYAIRIERCGGSADGDVVAIFPTLAEARQYLDDPPGWVAAAVLAIYDLAPCCEIGDDDDAE